MLQHVGDCSLLSAVIKPAAKSGMHAESLQSCPTLCDPMDCGPRGSSLHGLLQARILERVTIASCRDSSWTRDQTWVFCIGRQFFTTEPPRNPAKRWWVGITALQSGRVIQAFLPYASCCVFAARWPASSSARHLSDLHAASQVGAGSPTIEVTWQEVQLQTEITFGKACDYLVQVNRSY